MRRQEEHKRPAHCPLCRPADLPSVSYIASAEVRKPGNERRGYRPGESAPQHLSMSSPTGFRGRLFVRRLLTEVGVYPCLAVFSQLRDIQPPTLVVVDLSGRDASCHELKGLPARRQELEDVLRGEHGRRRATSPNSRAAATGRDNCRRLATSCRTGAAHPALHVGPGYRRSRPANDRVRTEAALACVVTVFGAARPHRLPVR